MSEGKYKILENQKKQVWLVAFAVIIGISLLVVPSFLDNDKKIAQTPNIVSLGDTVNKKGVTNIENLEAAMENKLEAMLSQIDGVGNVVVSVVLESGPEYQYAMNTNVSKVTSEENARDGGTRVTTELNEKNDIVIIHPGSNSNEPLVIKENSPTIKGVMVVAEGANNVDIKSKISRAVQTLLDIQAHRVTVLPKVGD